MFLLLYNDLRVCRNDSLFQDPRQWGKQIREKLHKNCMGGEGESLESRTEMLNVAVVGSRQ